MNPYLHSLSTVCLLKHYNQDYLLHSLRTDFTGLNGVGKSIIADLFQVVFIADQRHVKFATEGIDKKGRKIERLPYNSAVGYAFFNVKVAEGRFLLLGAAIFQQGQQLIKPFIITASVELEKDALEKHAFGINSLLFSSNFLKPAGDPYMLDELARVFPDKHNLFVHYFSSKEEKHVFYNWLYQNGLLPINLVKESNLKAFAKVIQSFSKSRALDIDSSKSLTEYLFEEDEIEISAEYAQQEQTIKKLLHQFKMTKEQISDISGKQADLRGLQKLEHEKNDAVYKLDTALYLQALAAKNKKQAEFEKTDKELQIKEKKLFLLKEQSPGLSRLAQEANLKAQQQYRIFTSLTGLQSSFTKLKTLIEDEESLRNIETGGLMDEVPERTVELLEKDARFYEENIQRSRGVLARYATVKAMERRKNEQDQWLNQKLRSVDDRIIQLEKFYRLLLEAGQNNLFVKSLITNNTLTKQEQAVLIYLRDVLLSRPPTALEGTRYTDSFDLLSELEIKDDKINKGWWIKTGPLFEFVPETSMLLPELPAMHFETLEELKNHIGSLKNDLNAEKSAYKNLQNGLLPPGFAGYEFDIDLSDHTKFQQHRLAAQLCAVVNYKIEEVKRKQAIESGEIEHLKQTYGISSEGLSYETLLSEEKRRFEEANTELQQHNNRLRENQSEAGQLSTELPYLREKHKIMEGELAETCANLQREESSFQARYPENILPLETDGSLVTSIPVLQQAFNASTGNYANEYNQITGKYEETKDHRDIRVNEQVRNQNFSFEILEHSLLGPKIRTLDLITDYLETLNTELLAITDDLLESVVKVFGKTENHYDRYKVLVNDLNTFFRGKLISNRFYFRIDFDPAPKLDIKWIEHLRKSAAGIAAGRINGELNPEQFIEDFYMKYSGNKSRVTIEDLLNPKRYFQLRGKLTDENNKEVPGSTGESYTAVALLGIARLSVVQDGGRKGLRFIILEESATLDNVNFAIFPSVARQYGYQIITMTPKPYAIGGDDGWYIHQLIPGKENKDINYAKTMSYFRTNRSQIELENYLKTRSS